MDVDSTIDFIVALRDQSNRAAAAQRLAAHLGVEELLLFVCDPDLGIFVPAPGYPQTLRGGSSWRKFLASCSGSEQWTGEVELPVGSTRTAVVYTAHPCAVVLLGGQPQASKLAALQSLLPMVAALLGAEQDAFLARAQAAEAKENVSRAHTLATALELARADAGSLNSELRTQARFKDQFLAMLGHELRNPLGALSNTVQVMKRRKPSADVAPRLMEIMTRQIDQLTRLVNDLLDVSRVSRGRIDLHCENIPLQLVLQDALEESRPLLTERQHSVDLQQLEPLFVYGDRIRLAQVFSNLVNNAAKYTPPGGMIAFSILQDGNNAVVRVRDNGIGISTDMLPRIFELFTQVTTSIEQARGGLGIGLTLVRTIIELHAGKVTAESDGIGQGTTIVITLPLVVQDQARTQSGVLAIDTIYPPMSEFNLGDQGDQAAASAP